MASAAAIGTRGGKRRSRSDEVGFFPRRKRVPSREKANADGGYQGKLTADGVQQQAHPTRVRQALKFFSYYLSLDRRA